MGSSTLGDATREELSKVLWKLKVSQIAFLTFHILGLDSDWLRDGLSENRILVRERRFSLLSRPAL
jgi:hypothetical protein